MQPSDKSIDDDWEEWDGRSPFWVHCVAGGLAGLVEHTAVYPLDTVRTHIQVACAACASPKTAPSTLSPADQAIFRGAHKKHPPALPTGMWQTIRHLMNEPTAAAMATVELQAPPSTAGWIRLWRGVQTMLIGCMPAHALYFSAYELVKNATKDSHGHVTAWGSSLAGAAAVCGHDLVMTPLDTVKQRMQLGHYANVSSAVAAMRRQEGMRVFYRSFPVTLASNVPYGMLMVSTHEMIKEALSTSDLPQWQTVLISSSAGGLVASALTTPLDRIKTTLQTQELLPVCYQKELRRCVMERHDSWMSAVRGIWRQEGAQGFVRGMLPRVLAHTPAVAISWTTYETAKDALMQRYG